LTGKKEGRRENRNKYVSDDSARPSSLAWQARTVKNYISFNVKLYPIGGYVVNLLEKIIKRKKKQTLKKCQVPPTSAPKKFQGADK
jgi:hypothetical protein